MDAIRYSFGGDEHVFAEIDEEMSLEAFFKGMAVCTELQTRSIPGVTEICPSNASYLVRFDPDVIHPDKMLGKLKEIEAELGSADLELPTRIIEIPVLYNDPWTHETLMRFRERHQDPNSTDLEYGARINGYKSVGEFIAAHASAPNNWKCRNISAHALIRPSSRSAMAAASPPSIRCAAPAAISCSASRRRRSTIRRRSCLT